MHLWVVLIQTIMVFPMNRDVVPDVTDNDEIDNNNDGNNGIGTDENGADGMGNGAGNGDNDLNQNLTDGGIDN